MGEYTYPTESFFLVPVQYVLILQLVCIPPDVLTIFEGVARLDVVKREQLFVFIAHVSHSKVD